MSMYDNDWLMAQSDGVKIGAHRGAQIGLEHGYQEGYSVGHTEGWNEAIDAEKEGILRLRAELDAAKNYALQLEIALKNANAEKDDLRHGYEQNTRLAHTWKMACYSLLTVVEPAMDMVADNADLRNKLMFASIRKFKSLGEQGIYADFVSDNEVVAKVSPKTANRFEGWYNQLLAIANKHQQADNNLAKAS